jgi:pilus assembly protein Flp/PilA
MVQLFRRFLKDDSANTSIEYCLIIAGISVAIVATLNGLTLKLNKAYSSVGLDAWRASWSAE